MASVMGLSLLFVPTTFCQVLLSRLFGGIVIVMLFSHSVAFVEKKENGMDRFCHNSYMRSVDNDELFQGLFTPKKILDGMDGLLRCDRY